MWRSIKGLFRYKKNDMIVLIQIVRLGDDVFILVLQYYKISAQSFPIFTFSHWPVTLPSMHWLPQSRWTYHHHVISMASNSRSTFESCCTVQNCSHIETKVLKGTTKSTPTPYTPHMIYSCHGDWEETIHMPSSSDILSCISESWKNMQFGANGKKD